MQSQSVLLDALLSLLKSTGVPIVDPRNGLTTPRIDLAAALGVVLGRPVPPLPSGPAAGPIVSPPLSARRFRTRASP
jgi:hypothetical protein